MLFRLRSNLGDMRSKQDHKAKMLENLFNIVMKGKTVFLFGIHEMDHNA